jgi:hypothetical protein
LGIDPAGLVVLRFDSVNKDLRDVFESRFGAWVVDERKDEIDGDDAFRFLVQFPDPRSIAGFRNEITLYQTNGAQHLLPPGLRGDVFDSLQSIAIPSAEDRTGPRLAREGAPEIGRFYLDVDLWHPGEQEPARQLLNQLRRICGRYDGRVVEDVRTESLLLAKVYGGQGLLEALLDWDVVARVDLPPKVAEAFSRMFMEQRVVEGAVLPMETDPVVCVLDSGVVSGHPLLRGWVVEERDFDTGEGTAADLNGHGTAVAGLVVYGDVATCLARNEWVPHVQICSAKILRDDPGFGEAGSGRVVFPEENRIERVVEEAIRYFAGARGCRIFNLSVGNEDEIYTGGRQFPLAEKLDELARELDIVIVVSAGNCSSPPIPEGTETREQFQSAVAQQLRAGGQRICNPATAALAITVGAVSRYDALGNYGGDRLALRDAIPGSPAGAPAPFTRTGPGYAPDGKKSSVKPELVHYGGNAAMQVVAGGAPRWNRSHLLLGEPTLRREEGGRFVGAVSGTSFAAPHVSYAAAAALRGLEESFGRAPSSNLVRALVGSSTGCPPCGTGWLGTERERLRTVGYGLPDVESLLWSNEHKVALLAEDSIADDTLHVFRVPVPGSFLSERGRRGVTVALAFDPPVRGSRKEYVARTMWVEVLQGLTTAEIETMRGRYVGEDAPRIPNGAALNLRPPRTDLQWSTMQVRTREWRQRPGFRVAAGDASPTLHVLVGCQSRFPTGLGDRQRYGLVVQFWHQGEHVQLYQTLRAVVRVPAVRTRVRV